MIKDDFYTAISSPIDGLKDFRDPLLKLSKEYPWFSAAHIYLTKADHTLGHVDYNDHLKLAAIHSFDREELWKFIMKETLQEKAVAIDKQITLEVEEEQIQQEQKSIEQEEVRQEPRQQEQVQEERKSIEQEEAQEEQEQASIEQESGEEEEKRIVHADEFDDMQREILLEAISSTIELESDEGEDNHTSSDAIHRAEEAGSSDEIYRAKDEQSTPIDRSALSPFAAFLLKKADESHWQEEHRTPAHITPESSNEPLPPVVDEALDPEEKKQSLIDQFIEKDPKITPGKAELFSTENLAKMSVVEDESFVTETMAQIYAKQGAWRKAKKAYEMLSLKFPEKSIYFANQIKKLQESRKSKK